MKFPTMIDIEQIYDFFEKLKKKYEELSTHIKFPEYSISIPESKDEFNSLFENLKWNNTYNISFFVKQKFLIKFDFLKEEIIIKSELPELYKQVEELITKSFFK